MKRLLAIGFIWFGCALAWVILGSTIVFRSGGAGSSLEGEVEQLWGGPMEQHPPRALYRETVPEKQTEQVPDGHGGSFTRELVRPVVHEYEVPLQGSRVTAHLALEQRQKGLLWFPTYTIGFEATYTFENPTNQPREIELRLPLMPGNAIYDGFTVRGAGEKQMAVLFPGDAAVWNDRFTSGEKRAYTVSYRSRGMRSWIYRLTEGTGQVRDFTLAADTNFHDVDFPLGTLSPSEHASTGGGWQGSWHFQSLVANGAVGIAMPQKLNPGDVASRITFFAPVGLLFFFFVVAVLAAAQRVEIHPLNYFLFGCAFFAFHLLFAYLVDQVSLLGAFTAASVTSIFLVVSYARLFTGWRFALREMAIAQGIYLVLFSFTFFWSGFTGLAITIGAIVTLFVIMQITGRVSWKRVMEAPAVPAAS